MTQAYLRHPSLHHNHVVFVSEDDLWLHDIDTQFTRRLTQGRGIVFTSLLNFRVVCTSICGIIRNLKKEK